MDKRDCYEVLGLNKNASQDEIKKAYRRLSKTHHPDMGGNEEQFKELSEAYEILSDTDKKSRYDKYGHEAPRGNQHQGYDPMAEFLRRSGFGRQEKNGIDLHLTVKLTLEEIFTGVNKNFKYNRNDSCGDCSGAGGYGKKVCVSCNGSGFFGEIINTPFGQVRNGMTCQTCEGEGATIDTKCNTCNGSGIKSVEDMVEINIPSGVMDGMTLMMDKKGHAIKGSVAGNLLIRIMELPHEIFIRNGNDLKMNLKLTYPQLILGDKIEISLLDGTKIRISIPEYSKVGDILKVSNKGMKILNSDNRGDTLLIVDLLVPNKINDEERNLIEKLKKMGENVVS